MTTVTDKRTRIVVALDRVDTPALDILRCLVSETFRQLHGLYVEDTRLLEHARSRLAREVLLSGAERPLEAEALRGQLRAQAELVRRHVQQWAIELGLPFSFQVTEGEPLKEMGRVAAEADSLVVSLNTESRESHVRWSAAIQELVRLPIRMLLFARRGWLTGKGVLAVVEEGPSAATVPALAGQLAQRSHSPLSFLVEVTDGDEQRRVEDVESAAARDPDHPASIAVVEQLDDDTIVAAAHEADARLVVLPWREELTRSDLFSRLLKNVGSAILLVK